MKYTHNQKAILLFKEYTHHKNYKSSSFSELLKHYMTCKKMNNSSFSLILGISPSYISSLTNEDPFEEIRHSTKLIVAICIALNLPPCMSYNLLHLAGCDLLNNSKDRAYDFLLNYYYNSSLEECNNILTALGQLPLTKY